MSDHISASLVHPSLLCCRLGPSPASSDCRARAIRISCIMGLHGQGKGQGRLPEYTEKLGCSLFLLKSKYAGSRAVQQDDCFIDL